MGYIYIQKTQEAVSSRFMIEQVFFTQSFTWFERNCRKNANFSTRQTYKVITGASRLQG